MFFNTCKCEYFFQIAIKELKCFLKMKKYNTFVVLTNIIIP